MSDLQGQDFFKEKGAKALASYIMGYWRAKGEKVNVWAEKVHITPDSFIHVVKSDLVNGLPAKAKVPA
jgi:hypothetical protein